MRESVGLHGSPALAEMLGGKIVPKPSAIKTVQYLPITPEMRKSVAEEGVPLFNRETPSATGQESNLDVNTNTEGDGGESPEPVETGSTGTAPTTVIPIQGGTVLAASPKQEPVVPIAHKIVAKVLPLSQVKVLAAGLNPNPQRQVSSVRDLMKIAKSKMIP